MRTIGTALHSRWVAKLRLLIKMETFGLHSCVLFRICSLYSFSSKSSALKVVSCCQTQTALVCFFFSSQTDCEHDLWCQNCVADFCSLLVMFVQNPSVSSDNDEQLETRVLLSAARLASHTFLPQTLSLWRAAGMGLPNTPRWAYICDQWRIVCVCTK